MARRPQKTIVDYLTILISPLLIMLLVGSIVFFVLEVGYEGKWTTRLRWVMFWFVVASVMIGRIAIEKGTGMAVFYALGLGTAIGLWTNKFLGVVPLVWGLLAFVWWFTHMMTKDCTVIEEDEDSSGEGLLQASGVEKPPEEAAAEAPAEANDGLPGRPPKKPPIWARWLPDFRRGKGKGHAPGKWLVWFSIFALPAFGFGHSLLADDREAAKAFGFQMLCLYVVMALCLLMTTSFLGLRRYLRQRYLRMPLSVTGLWMIMGSIIALVILGVALLLPRPNASYDVAAMIEQVADEVQKASDKAFSDDGVDDDTKKNFKETKEDVESDRGKQEKATGGTEQGKSGSFGQDAKPGDKDGQGNENEAGDSKDKKADLAAKESFEKKQMENQPKSKRGGDEFDPSDRKGKEESEKKKDPKLAEEGKFEEPDPKNSMKSPQWVGPAVKAAFYIIIGGVILFFLIKHHKAILAGLKKFWQDLLAMFGRKSTDPKKKAEIAVDEPVRPPKPFRKFQNPFQTGMVSRESTEQVINYSYRAMEAWAFEHDLPRNGDETPNEYGEWLSDNSMELGEFAEQMSRIYSIVAYTDEEAPADAMEVMKGLWGRLQAVRGV